MLTAAGLAGTANVAAVYGVDRRTVRRFRCITAQLSLFQQASVANRMLVKTGEPSSPTFPTFFMSSLAFDETEEKLGLQTLKCYCWSAKSFCGIGGNPRLRSAQVPGFPVEPAKLSMLVPQGSPTPGIPMSTLPKIGFEHRHPAAPGQRPGSSTCTQYHFMC